MSGAAERRYDELLKELRGDLRHYYRLGRANYYTAHFLRVGVILSSIAASVAGLFAAEARLAGALALLPAALALVSTRMKFQDRANWHYRKAEALDALRVLLTYQLPDPCTAADVSGVAQLKTEMVTRMTQEWEQLFGSDTDLVRDPPTVDRTHARPGSRKEQTGQP